MGYSVAVHTKSKRDHQKMLSFLEKEYRPLSELMKSSNSSFLKKKSIQYTFESPSPSSNLAYDKGKNPIGFNYSALSYEENYYIFTLMRWACLKVGRDYPFGSIKLKAIKYDGEELFPIHTSEEQFHHTPNDGRKYVVNDIGFIPYQDTLTYSLKHSEISIFIKPLIFLLNKLTQTSKFEDLLSEIVHEEVKRLEKAWSSFKSNSKLINQIRNLLVIVPKKII